MRVRSRAVQVHLFDGTYELFRAWFGAPQAKVNGREVGAVRVILRSLATLLRTGVITHAGVAYDHVIESFRNDLFPGYKTGEGLAPDLVAQFPLAERAADGDTDDECRSPPPNRATRRRLRRTLDPELLDQRCLIH